MTTSSTLFRTTRLLTLACGLALGAHAALAEDITIDASKAVAVDLPHANGETVAFKTPDGKEGWIRNISKDPLPTPAYAKGRIFSGCGFTSSTFLALSAGSGKVLWTQGTRDGGPTSPVVTEKYVAYNTESCDTEVRDPETGNLSWNEVTGGTLLTMPMIAENALVVPHPMLDRKVTIADNHFRMLAVDLQTLKHAWDADMTTDVLSAPVAADGHVYFACTDGRIFCLKIGNGGAQWHVVANATSAPVVVGNTLAVTTEEKSGSGAWVGIRRYDITDGSPKDEKPIARTAVAGQAKLGNGGMESASWDYQGPKIAATRERMFNAPGNTINAVGIEDGKLLWRAVVKGNGMSSAINSLTPPALGKEQLFIGSSKGHVLALKQSDGTVTHAYKFSESLTSQPILAEGNIYFGTASGNIVCLKLGDKDADGWHAWGGDAQHNKTE